MAPRAMFVSFLMVAGAFVCCWFSWMLIALIVSAWLFPETFQNLTSVPVAAAEVAGASDAIMPPTLFWTVTGLHLFVCGAVGWGLMRMKSPWTRQHVIFTAVLLFLTYLQGAANVADGMRWMPLVQMSLQPLALLAGANWLQRNREAA